LVTLYGDTARPARGGSWFSGSEGEGHFLFVGIKEKLREHVAALRIEICPLEKPGTRDRFDVRQSSTSDPIKCTRTIFSRAREEAKRFRR
jgi:hypothetical protein